MPRSRAWASSPFSISGFRSSVTVMPVPSQTKSFCWRLSRFPRCWNPTPQWRTNASPPARAADRPPGRAIAEQVRLRLSPDLVVALAGRQTRHAEAYDLYLRGRYFWNQLSAPGTRRAVEFFTRATELDPGYALAWSGLATAWASGPTARK